MTARVSAMRNSAPCTTDETLEGSASPYPTNPFEDGLLKTVAVRPFAEVRNNFAARLRSNSEPARTAAADSQRTARIASAQRTCLIMICGCGLALGLPWDCLQEDREDFVAVWRVVACHPPGITKDYKTNSVKPSGLCDLTFLSWSQERFCLE